MPRLTNQVPKYRKHRKSGQAFVELSAKRNYLGPHGTKASKREYDRLIAEWLASGRSTTYGQPAETITVAELIRDFLTHAAKYYGKSTRGTYANLVIAVRPLKELYGRTPVACFAKTGPVAMKVSSALLARRPFDEYETKTASFTGADCAQAARCEHGKPVAKSLRRKHCKLQDEFLTLEKSRV
jgi:hypothetical protein